MNQWDPTFSQRIIYEKSTEEGDPAATEKRMVPYLPEDNRCHWIKVKKPDYTQALGRDDLFAPAEKKPAEADWTGCVMACAEAEL